MPRNPNSDIYRQFLMPMRTDFSPVNLDEAFGCNDVTTPQMQVAIKEWFDLYFDMHDCCCDSSSAQRIPYNIVDGLTNAVFGEYEYSISSADYFERAAGAIESIRMSAFQNAMIGGEALVKVTPNRDNFDYTVVPRYNYMVFNRDSDKNITDIGMVECKHRSYGSQTYYYTLMERRHYDENLNVVIEYRLYRSLNEITGVANWCPGNLVPLNTIPEYAELEENAVITAKIDNLGLIPIRTSMVNSVDGSKEPVSFYAAAIKEIKRLYQHESRIESEYRLTHPRLIVAGDVEQRDRFGRLVALPEYVQAIDATTKDNSFQIFNPTPHQNELEARENQLLRNIENILSLRRGRLSNVDSEDRTATEVQVTTAREALTINSLQKMWDRFIEKAVIITGQLGRFYYNWDFTDYPEVQINWGNGVLYDEEREYTRLHDLVVEGLLKPEYLIAWLYNLPISTGSNEEVQRNAEIQRIRQTFMPSLTNVEAMNTVIG